MNTVKFNIRAKKTAICLPAKLFSSYFFPFVATFIGSCIIWQNAVDNFIQNERFFVYIHIYTIRVQLQTQGITIMHVHPYEQLIHDWIQWLARELKILGYTQRDIEGQKS